MTDNKILDALKYIDVAELTYEEWVHVGMALKQEGFDCSVWDSWSQKDSRYKPGECEAKWKSFAGSAKPIAGGTIVQMARERGYSSRRYEGNLCMDWNDVIEYDGDEYDENGVIYEMPAPVLRTQQLKSFLETLFKPDDIVGYVTGDVWQDESGKWFPSKGVYNRTCKELLAALDKHPDDLGAAVGDWKAECGAWIRFNPLDGNGVKNENITRFTYALVESDSMPVSEQDALYRKLELPIATLTHSGGKSLHAIVKVEAADYEEYRKRVDFLYDYLEKHGLKVDKQNRNPSRLTRMPGVTRNGKEQTLIATNVGRPSWDDWYEYAAEETDGLADVDYTNDLVDDRPPLAEELIEGVLRCGHKMIVSGASKAGKSFLLIELSISINEGRSFLGLACHRKKVLYINLEIDRASCMDRFYKISEALGIKKMRGRGVAVWNLRGHAMPLDKLVPKITRRVKKEEAQVVIIDPIYKVITGDENSATDMGYFCNQFDRICDATGASVIYAHHHSKGAQGGKIAQDRSSGSGVFSRDPDAIIDLVELTVDEAVMNKYADSPTQTAWQMDIITRDFKQPASRKIWFRYPLHVLDTVGALSNSYSRGSMEAARKKSPNTTTKSQRKEWLESAFECLQQNGTATIKDISEYVGRSERTVRRYIEEFSGVYKIEDCIVSKVRPNGPAKQNISKEETEDE